MFIYSLVAVSYTHLDVYKRQGWNSRRQTGKTADEGCKRGCEGWKIEEDKKDRKRQRKIEKQQKIEKVVKDSKR